jgi:hypothetical protein
LQHDIATDEFLAHSLQHAFSAPRLQHFPSAHDAAFAHLFVFMHALPSLSPWQHIADSLFPVFWWQHPISCSPAFFWQHGHPAFVSGCAGACGAPCAHTASASVRTITIVIGFIADFISISFMNAKNCMNVRLQMIKFPG